MDEIVERLLTRIDADASGYARGMQPAMKANSDFRRDMERSGDTFGRMWDKAMSGLGRLHLGISGLREVLGGVGKLLEQGKFAAEMRQLDKALPHVNMARLEEATDKTVSKVTLLRLAARAMNGEFRLTQHGMEVVLKAADNLADRGLGETTEIAENLIEALRKGSARGLKPYGIALDETGDKARDLSAMLEKYKSLASDTAPEDEAALSFEQMTKRIADAIDSARRWFGEIVLKASEVFDDLVESFRERWKELKEIAKDPFGTGKSTMAGNRTGDFLESIEAVAGRYGLKPRERGTVNFLNAMGAPAREEAEAAMWMDVYKEQMLTDPTGTMGKEVMAEFKRLTARRTAAAQEAGNARHEKWMQDPIARGLVEVRLKSGAYIGLMDPKTAAGIRQKVGPDVLISGNDAALQLVDDYLVKAQPLTEGAPGKKLPKGRGGGGRTDEAGWMPGQWISSGFGMLNRAVDEQSARFQKGLADLNAPISPNGPGFYDLPEPPSMYEQMYGERERMLGRSSMFGGAIGGAVGGANKSIEEQRAELDELHQVMQGVYAATGGMLSAMVESAVSGNATALKAARKRYAGECFATGLWALGQAGVGLLQGLFGDPRGFAAAAQAGKTAAANFAFSALLGGPGGSGGGGGGGGNVSAGTPAGGGFVSNRPSAGQGNVTNVYNFHEWVASKNEVVEQIEDATRHAKRAGVKREGGVTTFE